MAARNTQKVFTSTGQETPLLIDAILEYKKVKSAPATQEGKLFAADMKT